MCITSTKALQRCFAQIKHFTINAEKAKQEKEKLILFGVFILI